MSLAIGNRNILHIFRGSTAINRIYKGGFGPSDISVTFVDSQANNYFRYSEDNAEGDLDPSWFKSQIDDIYFYKGSYFQGTLTNKYQIFFKSSLSAPPILEINGRSYSMTNSGGDNSIWETVPVLNSADRPSTGDLTKTLKIRLNDNTYLAELDPTVFQNVNPPNIQRFAPSTANINLDVATPTTISFNLQVEAESGQIIHAHIVNRTTGGNVGPSYVSATGAGLTETVRNIPRPTQTTTYRLIAYTAGGSSFVDSTVAVTQAPVLSNLRRTNFIPAIAGVSGAQYTFEVTVVGYPQPTMTYNFSTGETGSITRLVPFANMVNTWLATFSHTFNNANARSLTVNAQNSRRTAHLTLGNINA